jgi:hypothetical protein
MNDPALSRRRLFGAAGAVAIAATVPSAPQAAATTPKPAPIPAGFGKASSPLADDRFPIGAFWPPPPDQTTARNYADMAAAGFTFLITGNYLLDENIIGYTLGMADQAGLKVLISTDPDFRVASRTFVIDDNRSAPMSISTSDARNLIGQALARYSGHRSFAGFGLIDEPPLDGSRNPALGRVTRVLHDLAPNCLSYVNLSYLPGVDYAGLLRSLVANGVSQVISFDYYPLRHEGEAAEFFRCWWLVRRAGLDSGLPTWMYIQTLSSNLLKAVTAAELAWQVNVSLAYGCKGIQYFTYWTPDPARGESFGPALVGLNGAKTESYFWAKKLNLEWLAPVGSELLPLVSESVVHANETPVPSGGPVGFSPDGYLQSVSGTVLVGRFASQSTKDRWLFVANRSRDEAVNARLVTNTAVVRGISRFDPAGRSYHAQSDASQISVSLAAGAAALYRLSVS